MMQLLGMYLVNATVVVMVGWMFATSPEERSRGRECSRYFYQKMSSGTRMAIAGALKRFSYVR
jgi:hypothetical protein